MGAFAIYEVVVLLELSEALCLDGAVKGVALPRAQTCRTLFAVSQYNRTIQNHQYPVVIRKLRKGRLLFIRVGAAQSPQKVPVQILGVRRIYGQLPGASARPLAQFVVFLFENPFFHNTIILSSQIIIYSSSFSQQNRFPKTSYPMMCRLPSGSVQKSRPPIISPALCTFPS